MRDEVIRIILEAKDKMSGVVRDTERNVERSLNNIRQDYRNFDREQEKSSNNWRRRLASEEGSFRMWNVSLRKHFRGIQTEAKKTREELDKLIGSKVEFDEHGNFRSVAKRKAEERQNPTRNPSVVASQSFFQKFSQGLKEAKELEDAFKERFAADDKQLKERKKLLKEEQKAAEESLRKFREDQTEQLRVKHAAEHIDLEKQFKERKAAEAAEQDERDSRAKIRQRKIKKFFDDERAARERELSHVLFERRKSTDEELYKLTREQKKRIKSVKRSNLDAESKDAQIDLIKKEISERKVAAREARREDKREREEAFKQTNREENAARDRLNNKITDVNAEIRRRNSKAVEQDIAKERAASIENTTRETNAARRTFRDTSSAIRSSFDSKLKNLEGQGEGDALKQFLQDRSAKQAAQDLGIFERAAVKAGNAWGDFWRGIKRGRNELRPLSKDLSRLDTAFARIGQTVGQFIKNFGNLVNLKWYLLISAIQILGQFVAVLGANLISLASSAALAASALGAAFLSAVSQAIPVVGLLAAAFSRVKAAFTAAQQATKASSQSSQDRKTQAEAEKAAQQGLTDALYNQAQAIQSLAEARKQAGRDIVDAIFAERQATLSLRDAEFAVLDAKEQLRKLEQQQKQDQQGTNDAKLQVEEAKQRLAVAKQEGDQAQIQAALEQLALAKQNLSQISGSSNSSDTKRQIAEQKNAVKEAELQLEEARVANKRQHQDSQLIVKQGIKNNQQVVSALHSVADAERGVANARQAVTDASTKQASAGNLLKQQLSQLDPAEKKLYKAFLRIRDNFKKIFRPITDIIVNAVTKVVDKFSSLLSNPQISKGFTGLSKAIGKGITDLAKFFTSDGFVNSFIGFIHAATQNIPTVIKIIENLTGAFIGLAQAGQPVFKDLLGRFEGVTGKFSNSIKKPAKVGKGIDERPRGSQPQTQGQAFISHAKTYLDSWIKLADAIGRVFRYLFVDAAPSGNSLVKAMTRMFNNLADFLKDNPQKVKKFFDGMVTSLKEIAGALFPVVQVLLSAFTGPNAAAFTKFTSEIIVPGLALMLKFTTLLAGVLLSLSNIPGVKFFLQLLVAEKALNKVFPATQKVTNALKDTGKWFFKVGQDGTRGFTKIWKAAKKSGELIVSGLDKGVKYMKTTFIPAVVKASKAVAKFVWQLTVAAVDGLKVFAKAVLATAYQALKTFVAFIIETVIPTLVELGLAMYAALGPWGLVAAAIAIVIGVIVLVLRHFHLLTPAIHAVADAFKYVYDWIKNNWPLLLAILTGPLGLAVYFFIKFKKKIIGLFEDIWNWLKHNWKTVIVDIITSPFLLGGIILSAILKFKGKILSIFKDIWKGITHIFGSVAHWLTSHLEPHVHIHHWHGIPYPSITFGDEPDNSKDAAPIKRQPGHPGTGTDGTGPSVGPNGDVGPTGSNGPPKKKKKYASGGQIPGYGGQAVPIIAHAGEWVLNKMQQMRLARRLGTTTQGASQYLFGEGSGGTGGISAPNSIHDTTPAWGVVEQQDQDGNNIYFYKLPNGIYVQTTEKIARRLAAIQKSREKMHHHRKNIAHIANKIHGRVPSFAAGGVIKPMYAMGGVVSSPQSMYGGSNWSSSHQNMHHKKIEQNFKVSTQGETDWNYVLRLAALHAQESF